MSEFQVEVVQLGKIGKHPNADTLSITQVMGAYPVIFRTGDFEPGGKAVYVPVDSIVPEDDQRWTFLGGHTRIRAKKLRGIFSMGILTEADASWAVGQNVQRELRITKYEPPVLSATHGANCEGPVFKFTDYDLEAYRRYPQVLRPGENVVITEKIHGANGRWTWQDGQLWAGSHHCWKVRAPNIWWQAADKYGLERLKDHEGAVLYGEVFGYVQDLRYGAGVGEIFLAIFDIRGKDGRWLEVNQMRELAWSLDIPTVPELYRGPWEPGLLSHAEGMTTLGGHHVREGIVIQAAPERFDEIGRAKLKHIGEGYHLRKEGAAPIMDGAPHREAASA